jgi:hypothetical protein
MLDQYLDILQTRLNDVLGQYRQASGPGMSLGRRRASSGAMT